MLSKVVITASHSRTNETPNSATSYLQLFDTFSDQVLCCIEWKDAFNHPCVFETTKMYFQPKQKCLFYVQLYTAKEAFDEKTRGIVYNIEIVVEKSNTTA